MKLLRRTLFGNPILRQKARSLTSEEILSTDIRDLIRDIRFTLEKRKYGVGLAAPQVGKRVALSVIGIKPTPTRPDTVRMELVVINPEIVKTYGRKKPLWEGCISLGTGTDVPYAQVPRYKKIRLRYLDELANTHEKDFEGLLAHVIQHEVDHLEGILFVDKVTDYTTFIRASEYRRRFVKHEDETGRS